jgi:glyoxylase-like metal-dependent hydrolase (beta-lactamase superfamily II)
MELTMKKELLTAQVGPYEMNTYVVVDPRTKTSVIIDPGGDPEKIIQLTSGTRVSTILITHGHSDHVLALDEVKSETKAPVYIHPADAESFNLPYDFALINNEVLSVGSSQMKIIHTPGHTPGQCCFDLGDKRIVVGDTIFVGGPGRTGTPEDFNQTMQTMKNIVFSWDDKTHFFPGHGPSGTIGTERPGFEKFLAEGWTDTTCGDITW